MVASYYRDLPGPEVALSGVHPDTDGYLISLSENDDIAPCASWVQTVSGPPEPLVTNEVNCPAPAADVFGGWCLATPDRTPSASARPGSAIRRPPPASSSPPSPRAPAWSTSCSRPARPPLPEPAVPTSRPSGRRPAHLRALDTHLYRDGRWLVVILGEVFTIGSAPPPARRRRP